MGDFEWTEGLCADLIEEAQEAAIQGGRATAGTRARVMDRDLPEELRHLAGQEVIIGEIATGSKGRPPFRKRLWVALRVEDKDGNVVRILANHLTTLATSDSE